MKKTHMRLRGFEFRVFSFEFEPEVREQKSFWFLVSSFWFSIRNSFPD